MMQEVQFISESLSQPMIAGDSFELPTFIWSVNYLAERQKARVIVIVDNSEVTVETAVSKACEKLGFSVSLGEDVHFASHCLTGKFMSERDCETFLTWARGNGISEGHLQSLLAGGDRLLAQYLEGDNSALTPLLSNLAERWSAFYTRSTRKHQSLDRLTSVLSSNHHLARRWIEWYGSQSYDPRGAPDLFMTRRDDDNWQWLEVKSVNDFLSTVQRAWIKGFSSNVAPRVGIVLLKPIRQ